jgi:hypothetical protein
MSSGTRTPAVMAKPLERIESSGQHCLVRERALKALIDQPKLEAAKQVLDD